MDFKIHTSDMYVISFTYMIHICPSCYNNLIPLYCTSVAGKTVFLVVPTYVEIRLSPSVTEVIIYYMVAMWIFLTSTQ